MTSHSFVVSEKSNSPLVIRSVDQQRDKTDHPLLASRSSNNNNNNNNNYHNNNNNNNLHNNNNHNNHSSIYDSDSKTRAGQIVRTSGPVVIMCGQRNIDLLRRRRGQRPDKDDEDESERLIVVNENKVYDLTDFARFHPGGSEILHEYRGQDIGDVMKSDQFHRHSKTAYKILDKYYIGDYYNTDHPVDDEGGSGDHWLKKQGENEKSEFQFNWNQPILGQLDQLGDKYFEWVHQPEEHHIRLFQSDFCEFFSKSPWWLVPLIWVPITCLALYYSYQNISIQTELLHLPFAQNGFEIQSHHLPVVYLVGMLQWTLLEYIIHRWLFHLKPIHSSPLFIRFHFLLHGQHHKAPMDKSRLVFPPIPAFAFALSIYKLLRSVFPIAVSQSLFAGIVLGYLIYDLIHYYLHHGTPAVQYFKELKHYHMLHHYVNQHSGFGISSKLWDYPFGTLIPTLPDN